MKTARILFALLLCAMSSVLYAQPRYISQSEAYEMVLQHFADQDVDIYHRNTNESWSFYIDAEPMKGWEHDCYIYNVPKSYYGSVSDVEPIIQHLRRPPHETYQPIRVVNRYGDTQNSQPHVGSSNSAGETNDAAQRTYALIINGGINPMSNYFRYWNDCSFIYQTLVNKYQIPKSHIYPLMSDGANPGADMRSAIGTMCSQPLDLDFDGIDDISYAATYNNLNYILNHLSNILNKDDHLFIYVIDHGGRNEYDNSSYICLWNYEDIYDYELAEMLEPFTDNLVNVNVVLGQCYSGGFVDNLRQIGCVVSAACQPDEPSWSCSDIPYDEFVYQWTSAVNQANHNGTPVSSDIDNNGRVTMNEAFNYARTHDRIVSEHPMYASTPISVGEDLAFNHIASSIGLYIKDNPEDTGIEPNTTTDEFWKSPSIWVRNQDDGIEEHQNPEYSADHHQSFVYVRVHNRGKETYTPSGDAKWVMLYWALASTGISQQTWKGREVYNNSHVTGGCLEARSIPEILPDSSAVLTFWWSLPYLLEDYPEGNFHFCLKAKIMDTCFDDGYVDGQIYFDSKSRNNEAQKNVTLIKREDLNKAFNVFVRNTHQAREGYSLEIVPHLPADSALFSRAKVELTMNPVIYDAWETGGFQHENIEYSSLQADADGRKMVKFVSPQSKLKNISLNTSEFDIVQLKFKFNTYPLHSSTYTVDLVQKDNEGNIIGGETFIVESPSRFIRPIEITSSSTGNNNYLLSLNDDEDFSSLEWFDSNGELIGQGDTITVSPRHEEETYSVVALTKKGEVATQEISLEKEFGIKSISFDSSNISIELKSDAPTNSQIYVTSLSGKPFKMVHNIIEGTNIVNINGLNLSRGLYAIDFVWNESIVDQKKIKVE